MSDELKMLQRAPNLGARIIVQIGGHQVYVSIVRWGNRLFTRTVDEDTGVIYHFADVLDSYRAATLHLDSGITSMERNMTGLKDLPRIF
jgi:hypothetical protein